ncbi:MAG: hypothetical protein RQ750_17045, partial [Roseovarius sp.]|nr:hypothetical protein [Roseovarius sp.]
MKFKLEPGFATTSSGLPDKPAFPKVKISDASWTAEPVLSAPKELNSAEVIDPAETVKLFTVGEPTNSPKPKSSPFDKTSTLDAAPVVLSPKPLITPVTAPVP